MRSYIPLLLGFAFISMHAMEEDAPISARIRYYEPNVMTMEPSGYVTVIITSNTNLYDIQNDMRRAVGPGNLQVGSVPIDAGAPVAAMPLSQRYISPSATKNALERFYIFWKH